MEKQSEFYIGADEVILHLEQATQEMIDADDPEALRKFYEKVFQPAKTKHLCDGN